MKLNYKFRIVESSIYKDGSSAWFYPEITTYIKKKTGFLWWRKEERIPEWKKIYFLDGKYTFVYDNSKVDFFTKMANADKVVAFKTYQEAEDFIVKYDAELAESIEQEIIKEQERQQKIYGAQMTDTIKIHELK